MTYCNFIVPLRLVRVYATPASFSFSYFSYIGLIWSLQMETPLPSILIRSSMVLFVHTSSGTQILGNCSVVPSSDAWGQ